MESLYTLAEQFRKAIDEALESGDFEDDYNFSKFPYGCCGFTSDLLAKYLYENGIETLYMSGKHKNNNQGHAWLETYDGTVIDITRDQFRNRRGTLRSKDPVYVGPEDSFTNAFKKDEPVKGYYEGQEEPNALGAETKMQREFKWRYAVIMRHI